MLGSGQRNAAQQGVGMAFSKEDRKRILEVVGQRAPVQASCPVCGHSSWGLVEAPVAFPLQETPGTFALGGRTIPCLVLICHYCGNTLFLNMLSLGLKDLTVAKETPEPEKR